VNAYKPSHIDIMDKDPLYKKANSQKKRSQSGHKNKHPTIEIEDNTQLFEEGLYHSYSKQRLSEEATGYSTSFKEEMHQGELTQQLQGEAVPLSAHTSVKERPHP
jgi:hypothetical protein